MTESTIIVETPLEDADALKAALNKSRPAFVKMREETRKQLQVDERVLYITFSI